MSGMTTTHEGIEIAYDEEKSVFVFELRGRNRSAPSLKAAKESIDKEPAEKRKQEFPRFEAYVIARYGAGIKIVTVTSVAEQDKYNGGTIFWVVEKKTKFRSKMAADTLFPVNDENTERVKVWTQLYVKRDALEKEMAQVHSTLKIAAVPKELR